MSWSTESGNRQKIVSEALAFTFPFLGAASAVIVVIGVCVLIKQSLDAKKAGMTFRRSRPRTTTRTTERRPSTSHHLTWPIPSSHESTTSPPGRPPTPHPAAFLEPPPYSELGRSYEKPPEYSP
ncbi:hypothetical protein PRIPAC_70482 [Pristionchus pacificus]|uniref:Uncharacterized protein n=1 Tax=Pristionchus pacificus TaxID=54126 RepID=A0A454XML9_PRIPA|nr:hypothetical protein PRIPAC_70482 [Pristionchus pacificus]|eukprot:PDM74062.1 hypothetical protein PRIPAC_41418 [Pristionchus pacificus]